MCLCGSFAIFVKLYSVSVCVCVVFVSSMCLCVFVCDLLCVVARFVFDCVWLRVCLCVSCVAYVFVCVVCVSCVSLHAGAFRLISFGMVYGLFCACLCLCVGG